MRKIKKGDNVVVIAGRDKGTMIGIWFSSGLALMRRVTS